MKKNRLTSSQLNESEQSQNQKGKAKMSRIDVMPADKGMFKVMVNFCQYGASLRNVILANNAATALKEIYINSVVTLAPIAPIPQTPPQK